MAKGIILFCIKAGKGHGFGHLKRSIQLFKELKGRYTIYFVIEGDEAAYKYLETLSILFMVYSGASNFIALVKSYKPCLVILDYRDSIISFTKRLRLYTKVLSIDDCGSGSVYNNININVLPVIGLDSANFSGLDYFIMDRSIATYKKKGGETVNNNYNRILISFGGEDPYGLGSFVIGLLKTFKHSYRVSVILGPLYSGYRAWDDVEVIDFPLDFYYELQCSDILITSFGLTIYEAIYIGIPVIVINPTNYHNMLASKLDGIINLGVADRSRANDIANSLEGYLMGSFELSSGISIDLNGARRLVDIIDCLVDSSDELCPICGAIGFVYSREAWANQYYCFTCYTMFRGLAYSYEEDYGDNYFIGQYASQYGRTYLEDKDQINILNMGRLNIINGIVDYNSGLKLLELGCALGFFLEMARDYGYSVSGIEFSSYGANYAINELGLGVINGNVNDLVLSGDEYDVVVAWYFLEHQKGFIAILRDIHKSLKSGGLLALSTPNVNGISFRSNKGLYMSRIPKDHYIEFSPKSLSTLLRSLGFRVERVVITGIHIKRLLPSFLYDRFSSFLVISRVLVWFMRLFKLGDTFEIYAIKE